MRGVTSGKRGVAVSLHKHYTSLAGHVGQVVSLIQKHPFRAIAVCLLLALLAGAGWCLLRSRGSLRLDALDEVCRKQGLQRRYPRTDPEPVEVLGRSLFCTQYTIDTRLHPMWDLAVYHDGHGRVWALAVHWWFNPALPPLEDIAFEPQNMDPFELAVFRMHFALSELELRKVKGQTLHKTMLNRRTDALQYLLEHTRALVVESEFVRPQLPHSVYSTGGFYMHRVGPWRALSYHPPPPGPPPAAGDCGIPYVVVHRKLLKQHWPSAFPTRRPDPQP